MHNYFISLLLDILHKMFKYYINKFIGQTWLLLKIMFKTTNVFLTNIVAKHNRRKELIFKLAQEDLVLRSDSKLCQLYIEGCIDHLNTVVSQHNGLQIGPIESVDDIVDVMKEMDFYFTHTKYSEIFKNTNSVNSFVVSGIAKREAVKGISNDLLTIAPKRIVALSDKINMDK
jgi:hypothetical protein